MKKSLFRVWAFLVVLCAVLPASAAEMLVYFGTFTQTNSEGIYVSRFDPDKGTLSPAELAAKTANPVFIALHPNREILYAIGERPSAGTGKLAGTIEAFKIGDAGKLELLGYQFAGGGPLCYVQIDRTSRTALAASYREGYVVSFSLQSNGAPREPVSFITHAGSSVHERQKGPHAHCIDLDPANAHALVADLGLDKVYSYAFDPEKNTLVQRENPLQTKPGAGPRHLAFDAAGRHVYVVNELDNTILVADYDSKSGRLTEKQVLPLLPSDFSGESTASEVVVHPSGRFLYASNRGHDSLALFAIAPDTGLLTFVNYMREGIKHPRHFAIDPSGRWLLSGNRDANTVTVYAIDPSTGRLTSTGTSVNVPMPSCVQFVAHP